MDTGLGKTLIVIGITLTVIGLLLTYAGKIPFLGKLPGDLRIEREHFSFYVPLGPYVYGTSQDQPSAGTRSWPVPGDTGNDLNIVTANGGTGVTVYTNVYDSSGAGITGGAEQKTK